MKLAICTKFQVNRMNCVESRRKGPIDPLPPPSRLRVTIFFFEASGVNDKLKFANEMGFYFKEKIVNIQIKLDNMASGLSARPSSSSNCSHPFTIIDRFSPTQKYES